MKISWKLNKAKNLTKILINSKHFSEAQAELKEDERY
jgi:hypothetical protein